MTLVWLAISTTGISTEFFESHRKSILLTSILKSILLLSRLKSLDESMLLSFQVDIARFDIFVQHGLFLIFGRVCHGFRLKKQDDYF